MGRLIDEDDVMHMLTGIELKNGTFTDVKTELRNVKTAYSVEKVVAEMKQHTRTMMPVIPAEEAIDIVKRGGVE